MISAQLFQSSHSVLVLGATGNQGQAAIKCFLGKNCYHKVKALVRDINTDKAHALLELGVELIVGDMDNLNSLVSAMSEIDYIFAYTPFNLVASDISTEFSLQIQRGENIVKAAKEAGVKHIVYTSGAMLKDHPDLPPAKIELFLKQSGTSYTILRPVFFMENWLWQVESIREHREVVLPLSTDAIFQQIATGDIAMIAHYAFCKPDEWKEKIIEIAGHACTVNELIESLSTVFGVPINYKQVQWNEFEAVSGPIMTSVYRFIETGSKVDISEVAVKCPGISLMPFDQYLASHVMKTPSYNT